MNNRDKWDSEDEEQQWQQLRKVYSDFIVYCRLKQQGESAQLPDLTPYSMNGIIKMSWFEEQHDVYKEAVKIAKELFDEQDFLIEALAWVAIENDNPAKALRLLSKIDPEGHILSTVNARILLAHKEKRISDAMQIGIKWWQKAYENNAQDFDAAMQLMILYQKLGIYNAVYYFAKEALFINPESTDALFHLANYEFQSGMAYASLGTLERLLDINPYHVHAWNQKGFIHKFLGDNDAALKDFDYSLTIAPNVTPTQVYAGYMHFIVGDYQGAKDLLAKVIETEVMVSKHNQDLSKDLLDNIELAYALTGMILLRDEDYKTAFKYFQKAINHEHRWIAFIGKLYLHYIGIRPLASSTLHSLQHALYATNEGRKQYIRCFFDKLDNRKRKTKPSVDTFIKLITHPIEDDFNIDLTDISTELMRIINKQ